MYLSPRSALLLLIALAPALPAFAQYQPSYTVLRSTQHVHVNRDGSHTDDISSLARIDTPKGVEALGERRLSYVGSLETMEVVEAWTLTPDGQRIDVTATTKGKGFAGSMKRHGFHGLRATHGVTRKHRSPGSIGGCSTPGRVFKGMKMAGRMGGDRQTTLNLTVQSVDAANGLLLIKGAVPGPKGALVFVRTAVKEA
jgi:50S ribosomal protein uL3